MYGDISSVLKILIQTMTIDNTDHKHPVNISLISAYILTINSYIFARHLIQIFTNRLFSGPFPGEAWVHIVNGLGYFATVLCGCLMAVIMRKRAWLTVLHSSLSTAIAMSMYVLMYYQPMEQYIYYSVLSLAVGAILGAAGCTVTFAIGYVFSKYRS